MRREKAAILFCAGTVLLVVAALSPNQRDEGVLLEEEDDWVRGGQKGMVGEAVGTGGQGQKEGAGGGEGQGIVMGSTNFNSGWPFPRDEEVVKFRKQWPAWAGAKGDWDQLPPDPLPALPVPPEEPFVAVTHRRSAPPEPHVIPEGEGPVDITGVGEGTERVRAGLEGPWGGIESSSRPNAWHEGGGSRARVPKRSSVAIKPVASAWVDTDGAGFPAAVSEGNFPGVSPDNPGGTSSYIGMHRDGEETLGSWANGGRPPATARSQQLLLASLADPGGEMPAGPAGGGGGKKGREGADVTAVGESGRDRFVPGAYGGPDATSWVVGVHREPHWTDSMTYSCGTTTPCEMGKADQGHYFQRDTNPFVDKRRAFDREAQLDPGNYDTGRDAFPWDPTRHPQIYGKVNGRPAADCSDGVLREGCFDRPLRAAVPPTPLPSGSRQKLLGGVGEAVGAPEHYDTGGFAADGAMVGEHQERAGRLERYADSDDDWRAWVDRALETNFEFDDRDLTRTR